MCPTSNLSATSSSEMLGDLLRATADRLGNRLESEILVGHVLGHNRAWLYAHAEQPVGITSRRVLQGLVNRRLDGVPIAYLTGSREFYGREFHVTPEVLIPRPETELLADVALALPLPESAGVLDIGTGSGCIALTLAAERPGWKVTGTDLSIEALEVASRNCAALGIDHAELLPGDLYAPIGNRRFDLIVSNPPYVAPGDPHLARGDVHHEPELALTSSGGGLDTIRSLVGGAAMHLRPGGWLVLEHGYDQSAGVRELMGNAGLREIRSIDDLAGIERVTLGRLANAND